MVEQTIAGHNNILSLRPNRLGGCYIKRVTHSFYFSIILNNAGAGTVMVEA